MEQLRTLLRIYDILHSHFYERATDLTGTESVTYAQFYRMIWFCFISCSLQ